MEISNFKGKQENIVIISTISCMTFQISHTSYKLVKSKNLILSPFSLYHSGSSLSPPLPTQTWSPGSLAVPKR